ncbi:hypothetical protein LXL04_005309 [Taraxacum kok-saghyz]
MLILATPISPIEPSLQGYSMRGHILTHLAAENHGRGHQEEQLEDTGVSLDDNATVTSINASSTTDRERSFPGMIDRALKKEFTENDQNDGWRRRDVVGVVAAVHTIFVDASLTVERVLHYARKVLLRSELIQSGTEERALLKNLVLGL